MHCCKKKKILLKLLALESGFVFGKKKKKWKPWKKIKGVVSKDFKMQKEIKTKHK